MRKFSAIIILSISILLTTSCKSKKYTTNVVESIEATTELVEVATENTTVNNTSFLMEKEITESIVNEIIIEKVFSDPDSLGNQRVKIERTINRSIELKVDHSKQGIENETILQIKEEAKQNQTNIKIEKEEKVVEKTGTKWWQKLLMGVGLMALLVTGIVLYKKLK